MAILDQFMQNPSTILGLSVLNQADRPAAGLLQGSLLNNRLAAQRSSLESDALRRDLMQQQIMKAQQDAELNKRRQSAYQDVFGRTPLTGANVHQMAAGQIPATVQSSFEQDPETAINELATVDPQLAVQMRNAMKPPAHGPTYNINPQLNPFAKKLQEGLSEDFRAQRTKAQGARQSLFRSQQALNLLNQGATLGTGATALNFMGGALKQAGINLAEDNRANSQAFGAMMATEVAQIIQQFGAGTGLSDADREFAKNAAGGNIEMDEKAIRRIMRINAEVNREFIDIHNKEAETIQAKLGDQVPFNLSVEQPEFPDFTEPDAVDLDAIKSRYRK